MHAPPEAARQIIHQHDVDQQQRVRFLFEVKMKLRPFSPVDPGRLDGEVDVRALEVVAARPRAEQPDPLDRGMPPEAAGQVLGRRAQIQRGGALVQRIAVGRPQHSATASREHSLGSLRHFIDHLLFDVAEGRLPARLKELADRHADPPFDLVVSVQKRHGQLPRKLPPDRGLATAGHADQGDAA